MKTSTVVVLTTSHADWTRHLQGYFVCRLFTLPTKKFWQSNFRHKMAWTVRQHDVSLVRVINPDGTCVRLLPGNTNGWSQAESKASQICLSNAAITGTLAVPMDDLRPGQWGASLCVNQTHCESTETFFFFKKKKKTS